MAYTSDIVGSDVFLNVTMLICSMIELEDYSGPVTNARDEAAHLWAEDYMHTLALEDDNVWENLSDREKETYYEQALESAEVYEYWAVSDWLGSKLAEAGEVVFETCGLTIWGRMTTGQAIAMDGVMKRIAEQL